MSIRALGAGSSAGPSSIRIARTVAQRSIQEHARFSTFRKTFAPAVAEQAMRIRPLRLPPVTTSRRVGIRNASSAAAPPPSGRATASEQEDPDPNDDEPPAGGSAYSRMKALSKKYGWWALGMYTFLSSIDFTLSFILVHSAGAERIEPYLHAGMQKYREIRHGAEEAAQLEQQDRDKAAAEEREEKEKLARMTDAERKQYKKGGQGWGSKTLWAELALAYAIHKTALLPVRAGLTVAWTPKFVKWLAARGWVGKGGITRAATHAQGKIKNASERVKEAVKRD